MTGRCVTGLPHLIALDFPPFHNITTCGGWYSCIPFSEEVRQKAALEERVKERKEMLATKLVTDIDYERKEDEKKALLKVRSLLLLLC